MERGKKEIMSEPLLNRMIISSLLTNSSVVNLWPPNDDNPSYRRQIVIRNHRIAMHVT